MFISEEISSIWRPEEKEEKKSPLEKGYKTQRQKENSGVKLYNGKNRKRRAKF